MIRNWYKKNNSWRGRGLVAAGAVSPGPRTMLKFMESILRHVRVHPVKISQWLKERY
jgi:hypothetical protein